MKPDSHVLDDDVLSDEELRARQAQIPGEVMSLEQIDGAETDWLWPDRISLGHLTVVFGASMSGKSMLAAELAAHVSRGATGSSATGPGAIGPVGRPAGTVLIAQAKGHENSVLKQRLVAAGADVRRVAVVNCSSQSPDDAEPGDAMTPGERLLCKLEDTLGQVRDVSLVVVDDLAGWLGPKRLPPDELAVIFQKLEELAVRKRIALVVLWRLEKGVRGGQARMLECVEAAAPLAWLVARDSYVEDERLAVCTHNRLGRQADNLAFRIAGHRLVWQAAARQATADDVLVAGTVDRHERRQAGEWLRELIARGPIEAKQLWDDARKCGLAERTVRRAAAELRLHPRKDGKSGTWYWGIGSARVAESPVNAEAPPEKEGAPSVATLQTVGSLADSAVAGQLSAVAAPSVAALPSVGSLASEAVVQVELRREAAPSVATLQTVGSLADSAAAGQVAPSGDAAPNVAALQTVGSLAQAQSPPPAATRCGRKGKRLTRRERQALERTMQICRDG